MTAVVAVSWVVFTLTPPPNDPNHIFGNLSTPQMIAILVSIPAVLVGVPCWIALASRTCLRTVRRYR
jgi:hypothetical protein